MASPPPPQIQPPPMQPGMTPAPPRRSGLLAQFQGLPWWLIVLAILPLSLIVLGGLIGAVIGVLGSLVNLAVARSGMSTAVKVIALVGITVACYVVDLIIVIVLFAALKPNG